MSKFEVNVPDARVKNWLPKLAKDDDASRSGELQLENVRILPRAAAALLLAAGGGEEVLDAFLRGPDFVQRFWGIGEIVISRELVKFPAKHKMRIDDLGDIRVDSIDKFRLRFEGGPQQHIWADFSIFLDDVSDEETAYLHWHIHRDIALVLEQSDDLVDQMIAAAQNMSVSTTVPPNGELNLDAQADADKERADQVADAMENGETAEIPLRGAKRKSKPAKKSSSRKASGKRSQTKKAG